MKIIKRTTRHIKSYNERTGEVKEGVEQEEIFYEPSEGGEYDVLTDEQPGVYFEEEYSEPLENGGKKGDEGLDKGKIWSGAVMPALTFFVLGIKFRMPFFYLTFLISSVWGICYTLHEIGK